MLPLIFLFFLLAHAGASTWYYVSISGSDSNSGTSQNAPWHSIAKVNATPLYAGDCVFFQGGQIFPGNLSFSGLRGGSVQRITISSYGTGTATIFALSGNALELDNCSYVNVGYLNFQGPGWNQGYITDGSIGVFFAQGSYSCSAYGCSANGFHRAGFSTDPSTSGNSLTSDSATGNGRMGIWIAGARHMIGNCRADNNPGDLTVTNNWSGSGIVADTASQISITGCEASGNGYGQPYGGNGPVGIWCWYSDGVYIGHCVSHDNHRGKASTDGGGFDFDGGTTNSLMEYCLSYNNEGAGYLIYNFNWNNIRNSGNTIRYCISNGDATKGMQAIVFGSSGVPLSNDTVMGNMFDVGNSGLSYSGTVSGVSFSNNVFMPNSVALKPDSESDQAF